jgi:hypothetical protein
MENEIAGKFWKFLAFHAEQSSNALRCFLLGRHLEGGEWMVVVVSHIPC